LVSMPGLFITFEGVDGAGKTTQIALLRATLEQDGFDVCVTREPGGDPLGESVRQLLLHSDMTPRAELLLFLASRAQNVEQVIRPHLAAGGVVLCDRFTDSSLAYQGHARGLGAETVARLNAFAVNGVTPDLTLLLDLPPEIGLARQAEHNRMEGQGLEFQQRVREGFLLAAQNNTERFRVLDAQAPVETLQATIYAEVRQLLERRAGGL
jgi:dTMP kinase